MSELAPDQKAFPNQPNRGVFGGLIAAILSGIAGAGATLAVSCCAGPALFIALGLGVGSASLFEKLAPYRWLFSIASVGMLTFAFWGLYLRKQPACEESCSQGPSRASRIVFWVAAVVVAASIIIPPALDAFMMKR